MWYKNTVLVGSPIANFSSVTFLRVVHHHVYQTIMEDIMCSNSLTLTIIFEPPFYKAIFESHSRSYSVATLNLDTTEPRIQNIYEFILHHWNRLNFFETKFTNRITHKKINPKRLQRLAKQQVLNNGISGTKAQQAIQLAREDSKNTRKKKKSIEKRNIKQQKFEQKQIKKVKKHRGH
ncbi:DUF2992 family protein [Pediococcus acidilactici]|nr:DUF2992 family protein [Pediococcus acidilactici]MCT3036787.1 DUF2992 family protein [Pediococcus acidilactici]